MIGNDTFIWIKNNKIITDESNNILVCSQCPCQEPTPIEGYYFADIISYDLPDYLRRAANEWPHYYTDSGTAGQGGQGNWYGAQHELQYEDIYAAHNVVSEFVGSGVLIPQVELYYQQTDGDKMRYYTLSLEGVGNKLVGKQNIYKEVAWFNQGDNFIVSGDQSSGFIYNYNLDSQQYNLSISEEATSGLLQSLKFNNTDYSISNNCEIIPGEIISYPIIPEEGDFPLISGLYVPANKKVETNNKYFLSRLYQGSQEGYVFTIIEPGQMTYFLLNVTFNNGAFLGGSQNKPEIGSTLYFRIYGSYFYPVVKKNNKYYGYSDDYKTISSFPSNIIESAVIEKDTSFPYYTDYIYFDFEGRYQAGYQQYYYSRYITDGDIDAWFEGQSVIVYDENNNPLTGCYTDLAEGIDYEQKEYYGYQNQNYYDWFYVKMFVNNYDSNTNTASTTIYKFGYNYYNYDDEGNYVGTETEISTAIPSTVTSFSAYVDPYAGFDPEPVIDYNVELNMFYFPDPEYVIHPSYTYRFFEMNGDTYYIYKAPKWVAKEDTGKQFLIDNMVVITGSNDSNYKVLSSLLYDSYYQPEDSELFEVQTSAGYWINYQASNQKSFYPLISGNDYYYFIEEHGLPVPLTGGVPSNWSKSTAYDDGSVGQRPPYFYRAANQYDAIGSGKYVDSNYNAVKLIVPVYYDTVYSFPINTLHEFQNVYSDDPIRKNADQMINKQRYAYIHPFLNYERITYTWGTDVPDWIQYITEHPVTIEQFLTPTYYSSALITNHPQWDIDPDAYYTDNLDQMYKIAGIYDQNSNGTIFNWGWQSQNDGSLINIGTVKFTKMSSSDIRDSYINPYLDWSLSTCQSDIQGVYCQILTGFWLLSIEDGVDGQRGFDCGIRKHGYFNQVLKLGEEYHFGIDCSNIELLSSLDDDSSKCITKSLNGNNLIQTTVGIYWSNINLTKTKFQKNSLVTSLSASDKFLTFNYVRPISGVTNLNGTDWQNNIFDKSKVNGN